MYTYAYLQIVCVLKFSCIASKEVAKNESAMGKPSLSLGNAKPTNLFVLLQYSTLDIMRVASALIATNGGALYLFR